MVWEEPESSQCCGPNRMCWKVRTPRSSLDWPRHPSPAPSRPLSHHLRFVFWLCCPPRACSSRTQRSRMGSRAWTLMTLARVVSARLARTHLES